MSNSEGRAFAPRARRGDFFPYPRMTDGAAIERRRRIAARILIGQGALLFIVALAQLASARGAGALDHAVAGVALLPMGLTTIIAANGVRAGSETAWRIAMINASALLLLPFVLALTVLLGPPLPLAALAPAMALSLIGIAMVFALLWARPN